MPAMRIALCNEVLKEMEFPEQCRLAAELGYDGLELAPFTFASSPELISPTDRRRIRRAAAEAGLQIVGLHWLLVTPPGLSINSPDEELRRRTLKVLLDLIDLCADLGGSVMVHGSPGQRNIAADDRPSHAWKRSVALFEQLSLRAEALGVSYCLEPLPPGQTNFINRVEEAVRLVRRVGNPAFKTMLDTLAASKAEQESPARVLDRWLPSGLIGHVHLNTPEGRAPGQGPATFSPVLETLCRHHYDGWISVEPFEFHPDASVTAAVAAGYLRGILERLEA